MMGIFHSYSDSYARGKNHIPLSLTPLIGRQEEVARLQALLQEQGTRLITISGPCGVGKTHFALNVANVVAESFEDGAFFVDLASIDDPNKVMSGLAYVLGMHEISDSLCQQHIHAFCRGKRLLLLFDNFEHLLGASTVLAELLSTHAGITIIVTSRAALNIHGERELRLYPLNLPASQSSLQDWQEFEQCASVQLFLHWAQVVNPSFRMTSTNATAIAEICMQLDGLPLAIEMAAVRIRLFSPQRILQFMQNKLQLLIGGTRDLPARQQTWHATLCWSYNLLNSEEQRLFRLCSIFKGTCSLDALAFLAAKTPLEIMDDVTTLLNSSLLQQHVLPDGEISLKLLSTFRDYGLELLVEHTELEQAQLTYTHYYQRLALEAEEKLTGSEKQDWLERLQIEHENMYDVTNRLMGQDREHEALRLGKVLYFSSLVQSQILEGSSWLARILSHSSMSDLSARARGLHYIGSSAFFAQNFLEAQAQLEGALCLYQELSAELKQAQVSCMLAYVYVAMQDYEKATEKAGAAIHVLRSVQRDDTQEAYSYTCMLLALIALSQQGCDEAVVYADSAVRHFREMENSRGEVSSLCALASAQFKVHDITGTFHCLEEALMLASQFDNKPLEIFCANLLGSLLVMRESLAQAAMVWGAASILSVECQQHNLYEQYALRLLPPDAYRAFMARAREQLGVEMYESWWKKGEHMTIEQAMEQEEQIVTKNLSVKQNLPGYMYQEQLTEREKEVLRLVSTGLTDAQVAQRLTVSPRTVSWHLSAIYRKINVSSRNAATVYAIEHHICQVSFSS